MITIELHSAESPNAVMASLRAHAGEWRESQLPEALRRAGVISVDSRVSDLTCTLTLSRRGYASSERGRILRVRATVLPAVGGTAVRVVAEYHMPMPLVVGLPILVTVGIWLVRFPPLFFGGPVLGLLVLYYLLIRDTNGGLTRAANSEVDYLIQRVEDAVAIARRTDVIAPAS
jgi:hypothetical protein